MDALVDAQVVLAAQAGDPDAVRDHVRGRRPALPLDALPQTAAPGQALAERTANRMGQVTESCEVLDATRWLAPADRELFSPWWQEVNGLLSRAEVAGALRLSVPHTAATGGSSAPPGTCAAARAAWTWARRASPP
ncbi:hypothetical protein [Actinosynnema pretiosum]|uniref:hypothetical protein n=1 Tax=Actinosynnema pretiosum TaxID=42197 RepID=UPI0012FDB1A4|nr:hypothetical protein [Actinosynnema pretiosum]